MSLDMFDAIENEEAAKEVDRKLALAFAIEQADERFGDYLRLSSNLKEFEDRWATVEKDLVSLATEKVSASPSNIRKIKGALKPTFNQRKASFQKNTWLFSPDLRVYTFEGESAEFTCPNCSSIKTAMGLSRCSCGTLWNAWSVVEGGRKRFLCREIEDRDTILASAPTKVSTSDTERSGGIQKTAVVLRWKKSSSGSGWYADGADLRYVVGRSDAGSGWVAKAYSLSSLESSSGDDFQYQYVEENAFPIETFTEDTKKICQMWAQAYEDSDSSVNRNLDAIDEIYYGQGGLNVIGAEDDSEPVESTNKVSREEISEDEPYLSAVVREAQRVSLAGDTSDDSDDDLFEDGEEMPRKGSSEYFSEIKNSQGKSFSEKVSATEDLRWVSNSHGGSFGFYTLVDLGEGREIADVGEVDDLEWVASFVDGSGDNYFRSKEEAVGWISNELEMFVPSLNIGPGGRVSNAIMKVTAEEKEYIEGWNSLDIPEDASDAFLEGYEARITSEGK